MKFIAVFPLALAFAGLPAFGYDLILRNKRMGERRGIDPAMQNIPA